MPEPVISLPFSLRFQAELIKAGGGRPAQEL